MIQFVWLKNTEQRQPVYHLLGDVVRIDPPTASGSLAYHTRCGRSTPSFMGARLRPDHAAKFARPCKRCFPGA